MTDVSHLPFKSSRTIPLREDRDWVTSEELIRDAGITYRQCDYWCRTDLLDTLEDRTPGSGFLRRFHEDQVIKAYVLRNLVEIGLSLQTCRLIIDDFLSQGSIDLGPFTLTTRPTPEGDSAA